MSKNKKREIVLSEGSNAKCRHRKDGIITVESLVVNMAFRIGSCSKCGMYVIEIGDCRGYKTLNIKDIKL